MGSGQVQILDGFGSDLIGRQLRCIGSKNWALAGCVGCKARHLKGSGAVMGQGVAAHLGLAAPPR